MGISLKKMRKVLDSAGFNISYVDWAHGNNSATKTVLFFNGKMVHVVEYRGIENKNRTKYNHNNLNPSYKFYESEDFGANAQVKLIDNAGGYTFFYVQARNVTHAIYRRKNQLMKVLGDNDNE